MDGQTATDRTVGGAEGGGHDKNDSTSFARSLAPSRQEEGSNTCSTCVAAASTYRDGLKGELRLRENHLLLQRHPGGGFHKTYGL